MATNNLVRSHQLFVCCLSTRNVRFPRLLRHPGFLTHPSRRHVACLTSAAVRCSGLELSIHSRKALHHLLCHIKPATATLNHVLGTSNSIRY
ncbi:hypothetical protein PoB_002644900 [Plakobranchus ocellatus]|uniref:Uncharacterized protein n=1 Tax=Plakobranchus ocellatus TaxID=259542 RepID=A0AAV3ZXA7_9GAST|nr:hypothetical protein PoB_002644900 [Plakobranchus ocellatus]